MNEQPEPTKNKEGESPGSIKSWKGYLFEFLMLFFAVTLGFFVENQRENYSERGQELQYMKSMIEDLESDTALLSENIRFRKDRDQMIDSLIYLINSPHRQDEGNDMYFYARKISLLLHAFPNDRTIQQLKSSGSLRLIRNLNVSNSIMAYDQTMRKQLYDLDDEVALRGQYRVLALKIFNGNVFSEMLQGDEIIKPRNNPQLIALDNFSLNEFIGYVQYIKKFNQTEANRAQELINQAEKLIQLIQEEYDLQ